MPSPGSAGHERQAWPAVWADQRMIAGLMEGYPGPHRWAGRDGGKSQSLMCGPTSRANCCSPPATPSNRASPSAHERRACGDWRSLQNQRVALCDNRQRRAAARFWDSPTHGELAGRHSSPPRALSDNQGSPAHYDAWTFKANPGRQSGPTLAAGHWWAGGRLLKPSSATPATVAQGSPQAAGWLALQRCQSKR